MQSVDVRSDKRQRKEEETLQQARAYQTVGAAATRELSELSEPL